VHWASSRIGCKMWLVQEGYAWWDIQGTTHKMYKLACGVGWHGSHVLV
jgi:hypothetical protein